MAKTNTTNNTDTTGTTPQAPAQEDTLVLVRVTKTGTLINGAYGRRRCDRQSDSLPGQGPGGGQAGRHHRRVTTNH